MPLVPPCFCALCYVDGAAAAAAAAAIAAACVTTAVAFAVYTVWGEAPAA